MDNQVWDNPELPASTPVVADQGTLPDAPASAVEPGESQETTTVDYEARARELEEQNRQLAERAKQVETTLGQVNQWADNYARQQEQTAEESRYQKWEADAIEHARSMPRDDGERYLQSEFRKMRSERDRANQMRLQKEREQYEQQVRAIAKPQYVDTVIRDMGLDSSYRDMLASLQNPDDIPRVAQVFQKQKQEQDALREQIKQVGRTQEAAALQSSGLGNVGGTAAPGVGAALPDDPDDRAIAILRQLQAR